jgi:hypothetical protein
LPAMRGSSVPPPRLPLNRPRRNLNPTNRSRAFSLAVGTEPA